MKKKKLLLFTVLAVLFASCSSNSEESDMGTSSNNELILKGKQFAKIHNEGLDYIYQNTYVSKTRSIDGFSTNLFASMIDATNSFIAKNIAKTRATGDDAIFVTKEMYDSVTIEDIKAKMTPKELEYTNYAVDNMDSAESLLDKVANDSELSEKQRLAVICFLTTLNASREYWEANITKWIGEENAPKTRARFEFDLKTVICSDAYWGYTGLLQSGLNPYVGGGTAALGSALSCIR